MTTSFTHKLFVLGILSIAVCASTLPAEAKWIINRAGDVVLVRSRVLGVESTGVVELDDMGIDEDMMRSATDEMMRELDKASQLPPDGMESPKPEPVQGMSIKDIGPVPEKFRHIERKDIKQIHIAPQDDMSAPPRDALVPVGGMGPEGKSQAWPKTPLEKGVSDVEARGDVQRSMKRPGVSVEVETDRDKLVIHQDELEIENKGGNMTIGPSFEKSNQLEMRRNEFRVKIPFPIKIDPATQEIRVESPTGDLPLRVMPEQAKAILDTKSKLSEIDETPPVPEVVDGKLSYTYKGQQARKLFGFIPVSLSKTIRVSAEDGTIVEEPQVGMWNRMKNWLSK
jgi:hypothetical protein